MRMRSAVSQGQGRILKELRGLDEGSNSESRRGHAIPRVLAGAVVGEGPPQMTCSPGAGDDWPPRGNITNQRSI